MPFVSPFLGASTGGWWAESPRLLLAIFEMVWALAQRTKPELAGVALLPRYCHPVGLLIFIPSPPDLCTRSIRTRAGFSTSCTASGSAQFFKNV